MHAFDGIVGGGSCRQVEFVDEVAWRHRDDRWGRVSHIAIEKRRGWEVDAGRRASVRTLRLFKSLGTLAGMWM